MTVLHMWPNIHLPLDNNIMKCFVVCEIIICITKTFYNYKRSTFNSRHKTKKADGHASKGQSWCEKQEAQQSPRDPRDALYQLKYCPTAVRKKNVCLVTFV